MRLAASVLAVALTGCSAEPKTVYVSVGTDALTSVRALAAKQGEPMQLLAANGDVAIVALEANELDALSHVMHEQFARCGGFMAHDSLEDARAALQPQPTQPAPDYTLDRGGIVERVLPALDREQIKKTIGELSAMPNRYYRSDTGAAASTYVPRLEKLESLSAESVAPTENR